MMLKLIKLPDYVGTGTKYVFALKWHFDRFCATEVHCPTVAVIPH